METIYLDDSGPADGPIAFIFKGEQKVRIIHTGTRMNTETDVPLVVEFSHLCGVYFFLKKPEVPFYSVPYLEIFASDGQGGWFAKTRDTGGGPIYYIAPDRKVHLVTEDCLEWYRTMLSDPDWRRKRLPGDWPRLPEDSEGRKRLAEALKLDSQLEEQSRPHPLPELFASWAEAEKKYPITDAWTLMRSEKTPRFQVHSMMSPQDREGRAFVHYQAWRETYPGLMPDDILEKHTLELCRKTVNNHRFSNSTNTFVALDRENDDRVVGFCTLSYQARDFASISNAGEIVALYVLREFQGYGIGKELLEKCLAWLPQSRVTLFVLKGNENAIGFYEHMGFCLTGHEVTQDGMTELEMVFEKT